MSQKSAVANPPPARSPKRPAAKGVQPNLKVLLGLTFLTAALLTPFVISPIYLEALRDQAVELHGFIRGEVYKQATGFGALLFALIETTLTVRKRSRSWPFSLKLPGSIQIWRTVHIFLGVAMVAMVGVHTIGSTGANFNAVFLWVFFGVTLTALVGVVAETSVLESTRRAFGQLPWENKPLSKGNLLRKLRSVWLVSHIFLVWLFGFMLLVHIGFVYYY